MPLRRTVLAASVTAVACLGLSAPAHAATPIVAGGAPVTVTTTTSGQNATLTFSGTAGQRVSLVMSDVTMGGSTCCGTKVSLLRPDGTALVRPTYVGTLGGFFDTKVLPVNGTYKIFVDPQGTVTGSMTLQLYNVPPDVTGPIPFGGAPTQVDLGTPGQNARLSFSGAVGRRVSVDVGGVTLASVKVSVLRPDGTAVAAALTINHNGGFLGPYTLPVAGTYKVFVNPVRAATGSATLALYDVPPDVTGSIAPGGASQSVTLTTPGQNARLTFSGTVGQRVSLKLSAVTIGSSTCCGAKVSIVKPDGTLLLPKLSFGTNGLFVEPLALPVTGTYKLVLDPQLAATGGATAQVYLVPADVTGSVAIGGSVTPTISTPGQNARYTFSGTAGKALTLTVSGFAVSTSTRITVKTPGGTIILSSFTSADKVLNVTLPVAGTYTLGFDPVGDGTGSLTLALS
jgi:hypothetical protein